MRDLFATDGLSFLRQPIGSSDFVDGPHYTFDDVAPGDTDFDLSEFTIEHDRAEILPLLRQALRLNPDLKVMGTPVEPAGVDEGQRLARRRPDEGRPAGLPGVRRLPGEVRAGLRGRGRAGLRADIQNEPQNRHPSGYPGTDLPVRQAIQVIDRLGPALKAAGLGTKIFGYDHNWSLHPDDEKATPPGEDPEREYPADLLESSAGRWLAGTAYHCYAGDQKRMTELHQRFPDKDIWFTECSGSHGPTDPPAQVFSDTLKWHARNLSLGRHPQLGEVDGHLEPRAAPRRRPAQRRLRHLHRRGHRPRRRHRHPQRGVLHARATSPASCGRVPGGWPARRTAPPRWNGMPMSSAFVNPDGSTALLVHNEHDDPRTVAVAVGGQSFDYTLPGGALATFTWPASKALSGGGDAGRPVDHLGDREHRRRRRRGRRRRRHRLARRRPSRRASGSRSTSAAGSGSAA